jgi:hypothetical protein
MIQTPLGEVDFGLTSKLVRGVYPEKERWFLQLAPYDIPYFTVFAPDFDLARTGAKKVDGNLLVPMAGLVRSGNFPL